MIWIFILNNFLNVELNWTSSSSFTTLVKTFVEVVSRFYINTKRFILFHNLCTERSKINVAIAHTL